MKASDESFLRSSSTKWEQLDQLIPDHLYFQKAPDGSPIVHQRANQNENQMHPESKLPTVLFVGDGRAGKDEAASYLSTISPLRYAGSFSWAGLPHMAKFLGVHPQVAWETRHAKRQLWKEELDRLRQIDQCFLARLVLKQGEVTAGLRDKLEIDAVKAEGLFDHIVWIDRPGNPKDPTVTFTIGDCTASILNNGSLAEFHAKIRKWARIVGIPLNIGVV